MTKVSTGTRFATMLLDHFIMTFVITIIAAPGVVYDMIQTFGDAGAPPKLFLGNYYLNIFAFSLYFNKDIILARSPAKRVLKLQVVDVKTGKPASPVRCLFRNITLVLWPIEAIVALANPERRIGDFIAGTKLMAYNPDGDKEQPNWSMVAIAILLSMLITYFVAFYPVELMTAGSGLTSAI